MNQFLDDMIHLTEGEKFVKYWWLWLAFFVAAVVIMTWYEIRKSNRE